MAFTQDTFAPISSGSTKAPAFWSYNTEDTALEVLTPGYFSDKKHQLRAEDVIWFASSTEQYLVRFISNDAQPEILAPKPPITVLSQSSIVIQQPTALDDPIQVEFGEASGTVDDPVMIDSLGTVTFNEKGFYNLTALVHMGRIGSSGSISLVFLRAVFNGNPLGNPVSARIDNPSIVIPEQFQTAISVEAGNVINLEIYRDSAGVNQGGLFPEVSTIGWGSSASASIRVEKLK